MTSGHVETERQCAGLRAQVASGKTLKDVDPSGLREVLPLQHARLMQVSAMRVLNCAWHPDSIHLLTIDQAGSVILWDTTKSVVRQYVARPFGTALAVAPDSDAEDATTVAVGGMDNAISICDMSLNNKTPEVTATLPAHGQSHDGMITSLAFLGNKDTLMSAGGDGDLRLWSVSKGCTVQRLRGHSKDVVGTAVRSNDKIGSAPRVASCSLDGTVRLWDARVGGTATHTFDCGNNEVGSVSFFPDGNAIAAGCSDGSVRFFDVRSYGEMGVLEAKNKMGAVTGIDVSNSGRSLFTCHDGGTLGVWDPLGTRKSLSAAMERKPHLSLINCSRANTISRARCCRRRRALCQSQRSEGMLGNRPLPCTEWRSPRRCESQWHGADFHLQGGLIECHETSKPDIRLCKDALVRRAATSNQVVRCACCGHGEKVGLTAAHAPCRSRWIVDGRGRSTGGLRADTLFGSGELKTAA